MRKIKHPLNIIGIVLILLCFSCICHAQTPTPIPTPVFYASYYFNAYDAGGEEWETNPANMVDNNTGNYAKSLTDNKVELLTGNTCSGTNLGTISAVEIRAYGIVDNPLSKVSFRPVFGGSSDGDDHQSSIYSSNAWSNRMNVTLDTNAPSPWLWTDVQNLDCDVIYKPHSASGSVSKVEIRITYNQPSPTPATTPTLIPSTPSATPTSTPLSVIFSGGGDAAAMGPYCPKGYYIGGCIYYDRRPVPANNYQLRYGDAPGGSWKIVLLGISQYEAVGLCGSDLSILTWTVSGGSAPAPIASYGNCAPTPATTPSVTLTPTPSVTPTPTSTPITPPPTPTPFPAEYGNGRALGYRTLLGPVRIRTTNEGYTKVATE